MPDHQVNDNTTLRGYAKLIADTIGTTDPATVAVVEDFMRDGRSGLDGLTRAEFQTLARQAFGDLLLMAASGDLDFYCEATGLDRPDVQVVEI